MIVLVRLVKAGTMVCFWEGPLVVDWIFLSLCPGLENVALWISMIFLFGNAGNASFILRIFTDELAAWA